MSNTIFDKWTKELPIKSREFLFRIWDPSKNKMIGIDSHNMFSNMIVPEGDSIVMQYTGWKKKEIPVFEYDLIRLEEDFDEGTTITYYCVVWIQEWSMFSLLDYGEFMGYDCGGVDALCDTMYWTYPLQDVDDKRYFLAGNIFQNSDRFKP